MNTSLQLRSVPNFLATAFADPATAPRPWRLPPLAGRAETAADFGETGWIDLDDDADAEDPIAEAERDDLQLLRSVACVAFATMVLAVVSTLLPAAPLMA